MTRGLKPEESKLKICLIGTFSRHLKDEGHTNTGFYLSTHLKQKHHVLELDGYEAWKPDFWVSIKHFNPDIIHFIPGASIWSFALLKLLKFYTGARTVISVVNPRLSSVSWKLVLLFKSDFIINQSYEVENLCNKLGIKTNLLPNGVDTNKFIPVSKEAKLALRDKYGIDRNKFIILHVGHLIEDRGLLPLCQLNNSENQVLIISSSYYKTSKPILDILNKNGCLVWQTYFENIWEIYQMADCYVFPTAGNKAMSQPLSVLEAMSCNLCVVSTRLDGLIRIYQPEVVKGLFYINEISELSSVIEKAINCSDRGTREAVLPYSWESIAARVGEFYGQMLN